MSFFGLTTLGPLHGPVTEAAAKTQVYPFHQFSDDDYVAAFNQYLVGDGSDVSIIMEVDGSTTALRASLGDMLKTLLGRPPRKHEFEAWFTYIDFDRSSLLSLDEYLRAVAALRAFSEAPTDPREYSSADTQRLNWLRSVRVGYEATRSYKTPLTTAMDIGWHCHKPGPPAERKTLSSTDVTTKEGRTARSYYGHFVCQN